MSMRRPSHDMGRVSWIGAESVGVPGQRTFRLLVMSDSTSAQLWLEKEQLAALARAIAAMLLEIDTERGFDIPPSEQPPDNPRPASFPARPDIEIHIGGLGLSYDSTDELIGIEASEREAEDDDDITFRCRATRAQMEKLQANSLEVVSAGRPRCPLCGSPLPTAGTPHFCPRTNGHQKLGDDD